MARRRRTVIGLVAMTAMTLVATTAAQAVVGDDEGANQAFRFAARIQVGDPPGKGCSGALVSPQWVLTAKACFGADVRAGAPAERTTVTVGRTDLQTTTGRVLPATWLVPHPDRNAVLIRLSLRVTDVPPVPVASTPAQAGEQLRVLGYGRTAGTWVPDRLHGAAVSVSDVGTATFGVAGVDAGQAVVCKGDAGGPAVRPAGDGFELVGIHHASGQQGCLDARDTSVDVTETRVDDLGSWIAQIAVPQCNATGAAHGTGQVGRTVPIADWNADCRADIMNQNTAGELHVFRNSGNLDGLFTARAKVGSGWAASAYPRLFTGDFTGDGRGDIVNQNVAGQLAIFPGSGNLAENALFTVRRLVGSGFTTSAYPSMTTGDFDGDGRTDLAARLSNGIQLRIFLSTGDVSADGRLFPAGPSATLDLLAADQDTTSTIGDVLPADVNGDGRTDIIGRNSDGRLFAWASTGVIAAGRLFGARIQVGSGWSTTSYPRVFVGDFNGDGRGDIVNQNTAGALRAWASTGDLSAPGRLFVGTAVTTESLGLTVAAYPRLLTGDIDGDGRTDLIAQAANGQLQAFRSTGEFANGRLLPGPARAVGSGWSTTAYPRIL